MPEPLRLDVELGAKGVAAGIGEIGKETDGLRVSTQKASTAVRGFVMDLSQARDGADVASAALGAFAKILGTSLAGTAVVIAGKALVDAFLKVGESVKVAKDAIAAANAEIAKMGAIRSFEDGARQAQILSTALEKANAEVRKLEESKLQSFIAEIRGSKKEILDSAEATKKLAQESVRAAIAIGAVEIERQKNLTETDKKLIQQNESYNKLAQFARSFGMEELARSLEDTQRREYAISLQEEQYKKEAQAQDDLWKKAEASWSAEEKATAQQIEANRKLAEERSKSFDAFIKAEQDAAQAREKEHQREIARSKEKISAIDEEISALTEKTGAMKAGIAEDVILGVLGRGPGQTPTGEEIGFRARQERAAGKARKAFSEDELTKEITRLQEKATKEKAEQGIFYEGIDPKSIGRREALKSLEDTAKKESIASDSTIKMGKEIEKATDKIQDLTKAKQEEIKKTEQVTDGFFKMAAPVDLVSASLGNASSNAQDVSSSFGTLAGSSGDANIGIEGLGAAAESANSYLTDLASSASNLNTIFAKMDEMNIQRITTDTIDTNSILLS